MMLSRRLPRATPGANHTRPSSGPRCSSVVSIEATMRTSCSATGHSRPRSQSPAMPHISAMTRELALFPHQHALVEGDDLGSYHVVAVRDDAFPTAPNTPVQRSDDP